MTDVRKINENLYRVVVNLVHLHSLLNDAYSRELLDAENRICSITGSFAMAGSTMEDDVLREIFHIEKSDLTDCLCHSDTMEEDSLHVMLESTSRLVRSLIDELLHFADVLSHTGNMDNTKTIEKLYNEIRDNVKKMNSYYNHMTKVRLGIGK